MLRAAVALPLAGILPKAGVISAVAAFLKVGAVSTAATFPAVVAAEFGAAEGGGSALGRIAEVTAVITGGILAILVWSRTRRTSPHRSQPQFDAQLQAPPQIQTPAQTHTRPQAEFLTYAALRPAPYYPRCPPPSSSRSSTGSPLRRLGTALLFGSAAAFLAPGTSSAAVLAALGCGFGYTMASRAAAAQAARTAQRRLAAAPPAIELFAAGLTAGLLPEQAAAVVVDAFGQTGPSADVDQDPLSQIAESFRQAAAILADTADPILAWAVLQQDPATEPVGTAALRSSRTGAPLAEAVMRAASATRIASRQAAQGQVRSVAVKAVAPLALCFLPAFVLIGIVPVALGLLREFQR